MQPNTAAQWDLVIGPVTLGQCPSCMGKLAVRGTLHATTRVDALMMFGKICRTYLKLDGGCQLIEAWIHHHGDLAYDEVDDMLRVVRTPTAPDDSLVRLAVMLCQQSVRRPVVMLWGELVPLDPFAPREEECEAPTLEPLFTVAVSALL